MNLKDISNIELLKLSSSITEELKDRGLIRTRNNPVGDYAEYLFSEAFNWKLETNSQKSIDAICKDGVSYQIKARKINQNNKSRQLSSIRTLTNQSFDYLAGIIFNPDYTILRAAIIPVEKVIELSTYKSHTNSWIFHLRDSVWDIPEVKDVTEHLKSFQEQQRH